MPTNVLALFGLDHTLLPHDTGTVWVDFLIENRAIDAGRFGSANHELVERYHRGEIDSRTFIEFQLASLAEVEPDRAIELRDRFVDEVVRGRITDRAQAMVDRHLDAGDVVVISTVVISYLARPIGAAFGVVNVIATDGELREGRFTGRVAGVINSREGKVERLNAWLAARGERLSDYRETWAYCDSRNDLPLLAQVSHPVAVNADPVLAAHARRSGWPIVQFA